MFRKKSEKDPDKKKKLFLTKRFNQAVNFGKISGGTLAAFTIPLAFVDGGASLFVLVCGGASFSALTAYAAALELSQNQKIMLETNAGQELYGPIWGHEFYSKLERELIKTCDKIRYLNQSENKKRKKLEKKKAKLIEVARDLSEYLQVADKDHKPSGEPMLIMIREKTGDKEKDAPYTIDVLNGRPSPKNSPAAFGI